MKKLLFSIGMLLLSINLWAQAPQKMTYQSVIRNSSDALVTSTAVGMQMSILQGTPTGIAVFIETHQPTTNVNGLATIEIGSGTTVAGNFSTIDWSAGPYYLKTEVDPNGGTAYTISGTTQLLSVPYALYAENSGNGFSGDYNDLTNTPTNVSAFTNDAGYITSPNDADADPTNEIQTLSVAGNNLTISGTGGNTVTLPSASGNTLDQSYDQGGAGLGRIITADAGAVEINSSTASQATLSVSHASTGVALLANGTSTGSTFSTIQASTASSSNSASAVIGNSSGLAWGVSGQVLSTATAEAAVYGNNLRTNGGYGVKGIGYNGVWGISAQQTGAGTWGENTNTNGTGIAGMGNAQAPQVLAAGSGGALMGYTTGLFTKFNTPGVGQGITIQDDFGAQWTVGDWDGASYRKIAGVGTVNTIVPDLDDKPVLMTAPEAPEVLFQDYGSGQLINGEATITIDPILAKNIRVDAEHPLRVFVTLEGDCNGVYVTNKTATGFVVKELMNGSSNTAFTYQIVANRSDEKLPGLRPAKYSEERFTPAKTLMETKTLSTPKTEQRTLNIED